MLAVESLTLKHDGKPLSRYEVRVEASSGELSSVRRPRASGISLARSQPRLFALDKLAAAALFPYAEPL